MSVYLDLFYYRIHEFLMGLILIKYKDLDLELKEQKDTPRGTKTGLHVGLGTFIPQPRAASPVVVPEFPQGTCGRECRRLSYERSLSPDPDLPPTRRHSDVVLFLVSTPRTFPPLSSVSHVGRRTGSTPVFVSSQPFPKRPECPQPCPDEWCLRPSLSLCIADVSPLEEGGRRVKDLGVHLVWSL